MRLKYRIPLAIIAICMVITMFIASSYALWSVTITQESKNIIESGCFSITFDDTDSSSINLTNAYPISDEKGLKTTPYAFTIKNTCTVDAKFTLYLNSLDVVNKLSDEYIKYSLVEERSGISVANSPTGIELSTTSKDDLNKGQFGFEKDVVHSYEIATGTLKGRTIVKNEDGTPQKNEDGTVKTLDDGGTQKYHLRLWIDSKAKNSERDEAGNVIAGKEGIEGKTFEAGVSVVAYATKLDTETTTEPTESTTVTD